MTDWQRAKSLIEKALEEYLANNGYDGFAWHISDLVVFDEPKELREFYKHVFDKKGYADDLATIGVQLGLVDKHTKFIPLKRPPQSWQYVETDDFKYRFKFS